MNPALVILAAGLSTRFGGNPKQLSAVGPAGETLMDYAIHDAVLAGFGRVVLVVRPALCDAFAAHVDRWSARIDIHVAEQSAAGYAVRYPHIAGRSRPLGTVHAVLAARDMVDGPFVIMNADDYYGPDAFHLLAGAIAAEGRLTECTLPVRGWLAGYRLQDTLSGNGGVTRALCTVTGDDTLAEVVEAFDVQREKGCIRGVVRGEERDLGGREVVSTNLWGFEHAAFEMMEQALQGFLSGSPGETDELRIADAVTGWLRRGDAVIRVLPTGGQWFGLTYEADLPAVRRAIAGLLETGAYPADLTGGS